MIEVNNISKSFGDIVALSDVSFNIGKGEIVAFLGPNGAGKTTTMKVLTGYWSADSGEVRVAGINPCQKPEAAKRKIGYLPETVPLYEDMKVFEYLKFVAEIRDLSSDSVLPRIKEVAESCGLNKVIGQPISQLSKGYKQRVGLAQAILHDPDILILDEPTTGLDPNQIAEIRALIKSIGKEKTVLFSTHILAEASAICDRILIIHKGKIVAQGTAQELSARAKGGLLKIKLLNVKQDDFNAAISEMHLSTCSKYEESNNELKIELTLKQDSQAPMEIAKMIAKKQWPVLEMTYESASLEDIFRELTKENL